MRRGRLILSGPGARRLPSCAGPGLEWGCRRAALLQSSSLVALAFSALAGRSRGRETASSSGRARLRVREELGRGPPRLPWEKSFYLRLLRSARGAAAGRRSGRAVGTSFRKCHRSNFAPRLPAGSARLGRIGIAGRRAASSACRQASRRAG